MNNKGFAISGILYSILIIFVVSIAVMLFNLQNRKTILDEIKVDAVEAVNFDSSIDYLTERINVLEEKINILENSASTGNKTLLWENPIPTDGSGLSPQTLTLSSDDYDYLIVIFSVAGVDIPTEDSVFVIKGHDFVMSTSFKGAVFTRKATFVSDTEISIETGYGGSTANTGRAVPMYVYGIK